MSEQRPPARTVLHFDSSLAPQQTGPETSQRSGAQLPEAELQHRIRNLLALLRSVVRRTAESSETVEEYVMHLEGRLGAIARGQDIVLWNRGETGVDLAYLLAEELLAHGAQEGQQVTVAGPPIELRNRAAALLGLAIHELTVNAVKFGALRDQAGHIIVDWSIEHISLAGAEGGSLWLRWKEKLGSSSVAQARRHGFGTELIERMLPYELNAETILEPLEDGLRCTIAVPLSADVAPGQPVPFSESE